MDLTGYGGYFITALGMVITALLTYIATKRRDDAGVATALRSEIDARVKVLEAELDQKRVDQANEVIQLRKDFAITHEMLQALRLEVNDLHHQATEFKKEVARLGDTVTSQAKRILELQTALDTANAKILAQEALITSLYTEIAGLKNTRD